VVELEERTEWQGACAATAHKHARIVRPISPASSAMIAPCITFGNPPMTSFRPRTATLALAALCLSATALAQPDLAASAAKDKGAVVAPSGLVYLSVREGRGASPAATDTVKVHYRGTLANGTEFDSSYKRNEPTQFPLNGVIPCWTEGVQRMKAGGKAKLTCPPSIAYGDRGAGGVIPPNATLQFEIELLEIAKR
jgi:FKBP-type peptidyl-prolyl cis-trans isomerase FkpA